MSARTTPQPQQRRVDLNVTEGRALTYLNTAALIGGRLLPHQAAALDWLKEHPRAVIADDVGLGKTVVTCAYLAHLAETGHLKTGERRDRALLVVPAPLISQWRGELARFVPALTAADSSEKAYANPGKKQALEQIARFPLGPDIELVSYEFMRSRADVLGTKRFRTVIFDEASSLKGRGAEQQAGRALTLAADRTLALTATPVELDVMETHSILATIRVPGLPTERHWGEHFCIWSDGYQPSYGPYVEPKPIGVRPDNLDELRAFLDTCVLRRTAEDAGLDMPAFVGPAVRWVQLTAPQQVAYGRAESYSDLKRHQLREQACGWIDGRSAKAEEAVRFLHERPDIAKAIIWAERLEHLSLAGHLLTAAGISWVRIDGGKDKSERADALEAFRDDPSVRVLLGSTVLERGVNAQHCRVLISLGSSFNPARERQREGRIRRIGSPHRTVEHVCILTDTPHEVGKWTTVARRRASAEAVLDAASV